MKVLFLTILLGSLNAAQFQGGVIREFQNVATDSAAVDSVLASSTPFVGVDPIETRLTVAFVLVFVLVMLTMLLTLKIQTADRRRGIR